MCGIAGLWDHKAEHALEPVIRAMTNSLQHRGPDDCGVLWNEAGVALGQRRLAIIDLSREGHQPMRSHSGRYVLVFNGEVYNFRELRAELERKAHTFRGHSDTEVILALIEEHGLVAAVKQFVGMFALALWDNERQELSLVRDRLGIKPLYYGWSRSGLLFGSELKAFHQHPAFEPRLNEEVVPAFVQYHYVPSPHSIFRDVYKLPPGCILTVSANWVHTRSGFSPEPDEQSAGHRPRRYWSANEVALRGQAEPFEGSDIDAVRHADKLLRQAIGLRMIADVDLGAFLSGGIDSSTVVALMQAQSSRPVKTFTIGFNEFGFNEALIAKQVATHLGTDHHELYVSAQEARDVIPQLPEFYDEPFSDSSQIPTYLVSRLARSQVKVSLSGDGGDELFGGYNRHVGLAALGRWPDRLPGTVRHSIGRSMDSWNTGEDEPSGSAPTMTAIRKQRAARALQKLGAVFSEASHRQLYPLLVADWKNPGTICQNDAQATLSLTQPAAGADALTRPLAIMLCDLISYLPEDILTKVDRASMAVALEARVPLLDHRVVEFAWTLPLHMKIRKRQGKWLLREVLARYVPRAHFERPKQGFSIPIGQWLRGPLRAWAEELIDERRLASGGVFKPEAIRRLWQSHLSGQRNHEHRLWSVLMFQAWRERWLH